MSKMSKLVFFLLLSTPLIYGKIGEDCSVDPNICDSDKFLVCGTEGKCKCEDDLDWIADSCTIRYGNECKKDNGPPCKEEKFQECDGTKCSCKNDDWKYDSKDDACSIQWGKVCEKDQPCYANSECKVTDNPNGNGRCTCLGNFPPNEDAECIYGYGKTCLPNANLCNTEAGLICNRTTLTCTCESNNEYEESSKKCKKPLDALCTDDEECFSLAKCSEGKCTCQAGLIPGKAGKCVIENGKPCTAAPGACDKDGNQICKEGKCTCTDEEAMEFFPPLKSCYATKGKKCYNTPVCHPDLACDSQTGTCECDSKRGYVDQNGECKIIYGYPCREEGKIGQCSSDHNLVCGDSDTCECKPEYDHTFQGGNRICAAKYGAPCSISKTYECNLDKVLKCNASTHCGCFYYDQEYDPKSGVCKSLLYEYCDLDTNPDQTKPWFITCGNNMECRKRPNINSGHCRCVEGYLEIGRQCSDGNINFPGFSLFLVSGIVVLIRLNIFG